jgi:hypothetical protein
MTPHVSKQVSDGGNSNPIPPVNNAVEIFDDIQAAANVGGIKPRAIRDWRTRRGLPFIRITAKVCRIRRTDLDRWLNRHQVAITRGA